MSISIGESILAGSAIFATMGVIIKLLAVRQSTVKSNIYNAQNAPFPEGTGAPSVSRKDLDSILNERNAKFINLVTDPVCLARSQSIERHVTDIFNGLTKQMDEVKTIQGKIFNKLDEIKECQIEAAKKGAT